MVSRTGPQHEVASEQQEEHRQAERERHDLVRFDVEHFRNDPAPAACHTVGSGCALHGIEPLLNVRQRLLARKITHGNTGTRKYWPLARHSGESRNPALDGVTKKLDPGVRRDDGFP
jgi:hypothetical protein